MAWACSMALRVFAADVGPVGLAAFSGAEPGEVKPPWRVRGLPHKDVALPRFEIVDLAGERVLRVQSDAAYGNLLHPWPASGPATIRQIAWRWRLDQALTRSDLASRAADDVALKLCVLFDMPATQLPWTDRMQLALASAWMGEPLPAATLCYVWDRLLPVGRVVPNAYSARVRYLVVDSGAAGLGQWSAHQRDIAADFAQAFATEREGLPRAMAVAVGSDTDNTGERTIGYVGDVRVRP